MQIFWRILHLGPCTDSADLLCMDMELSCFNFWTMDITSQFTVCARRGAVSCMVGTDIKYHIFAVLSPCY